MPKQLTLYEDLSPTLAEDSTPAAATGIGGLSPPSEAAYRPVHYLGSKLRLAEAIRAAINEVDPSRRRVCDLFSGSGTVSGYLGQERPVTAVDIQEYARVLCAAVLRPAQLNSSELSDWVRNAQRSEVADSLSWAFEPLVSYEYTCRERARQGDLEGICEIIEFGSLVAFERDGADNRSEELTRACHDVQQRLETLEPEAQRSAVVARYYGGVYFSYKQAVHLDILASIARAAHGDDRNSLVAAALSAASNVVNTVGKQFAQPLRPRDSNSRPKSGLLRKVETDRDKEVERYFLAAAEQICSREVPDFGHQTLRGEYSDALECNDVGAVYADPPYTRDHYSRFYHILETIAAGDEPIVSTVVRGGNERVSRGIYREERYQSPFCIKSEAPAAFQDLFARVSGGGRPLVLSYSPHEAEDGTHPRVVSLSTIESLARKNFAEVSVRDVSGVAHSYLNHSSRRLETRKNAEVLILCWP